MTGVARTERSGFPGGFGGSDVVAGRYALVDPIASGGTGTVWRAYDHERDQWCAAKVMRHRHAGELLRFAREQSVRLNHPHIASPYAWAADDGTVLIASELVDGGSLHTLLCDYGPLDEPSVVVVLDQVLAALAAVHDAGLVHRDVKPGNILLRATGDGPEHCMLTDFGLTIGADDPRLTQTGMVIGTLGYLPPEVMVGTARPHPSHDVYAVGRLALTLALDQRTGDGHDLHEAELDRLDDAQLRGAVRAMLDPDPNRRPVDAAAATRLLAGLPRVTGGLRTADAEPVTVFDQLPPLAGLRPTETTVRRHRPTPPEPPGPSATSAAGPAAATGSERRSPTRVRTVAAAAVAALIVAGGAALVLRDGGPDGIESIRPPGRTAVVPTTAPSGAVDATSSPALPPSGLTPPTKTATVTSGSGCSWQQQGDVVDTASGRLVCTLRGGAYRWLAPGG